jgi:hypothetical protein
VSTSTECTESHASLAGPRDLASRHFAFDSCRISIPCAQNRISTAAFCGVTVRTRQSPRVSCLTAEEKTKRVPPRRIALQFWQRKRPAQPIDS